MRTMVIGLGPEYNYKIDNHEVWQEDNTKYASNHGASLISRTLLNFFDADYIDDFTQVKSYKNKYDLCVIAFATHVTDKRDVSRYTKFVKELNIKTIAFSLGIQDYSNSSFNVGDLNPSLIELLNYVIKSSKFIGVRGPHTASTLLKAGFKQKNIIPFGCPTIYTPLKRDFKIKKKNSFSKPLVVYHRTMSELNQNILTEAPLLGQDFLDEVIFKDEIPKEQPIKQSELIHYSRSKNGKVALNQIKSQGIFKDNFQEWFDVIGNSDFVLGARLHGCIAALIQGIPAVMIARDIRVQEIAEFYKIPYIIYEDVGKKTIQDIFNEADYSEFNELYQYRFDNFVKLMKDLDVIDNLSFEAKIPENYYFTIEDLNANTEILFTEIRALVKNSNSVKEELSSKIVKVNNRIDQLIFYLNKIPGVRTLKKMLK